MILYPRPAPPPRQRLSRPKGPGRPALARGLALDKDFDEGKHPRDDDGKFSKGAGAAASLPTPKGYLGKGGKLIHSIAHAGLSKGDSPQDIAAKIKAAVATYIHPNFATYGNQALAHLEKEHGLAKGALGKAATTPGMTKPTAPVHPPKTTSAVPAPAPKTPPPAKPYDDDAEEAELETFEPDPDDEGDPVDEPAPAAAKPAMTLKETLAQIKAEYDPHPDSIGQKQVYKIATSLDKSTAEKVAEIKLLTANLQSGYNKDFADKWIHQLDPGGVAAAEAAKTQKGVTTPPAHMKRYQRIQAIYKGAKKFSDATQSSASTAVPSLKSSWWKNVDSEGRGAVQSYTGHSYGQINSALRKMGEGTTAHQVAMTQAIDELFEEPGAKLEHDIILRRGDGPLPDGVLEKYEAALKTGISVRMMKEGFISTSLADDSAFGGKVKYEIVARAGTPALGVHAISQHKNENEVLLRHGQVFEVFEIQRGDYSTTIKMMTV